jgi:hypothetical protein
VERQALFSKYDIPEVTEGIKPFGCQDGDYTEGEDVLPCSEVLLLSLRRSSSSQEDCFLKGTCILSDRRP